MSIKKRKCYQLMVSKVFLKGMPNEGEETGFVRKIHSGDKKHTIRTNYEYWEYMFDQIQQDRAYLSVRYWSGKPYRSKHVIVKDFYKKDGIGLEKLEFTNNGAKINGRSNLVDLSDLAENDGLSYKQLLTWFKEEQNKALPLIHFTSMRYLNQ